MSIKNNEEATGLPLLIKAAEVARILNVSERTLWRLKSAKKIPEPVRLGGIVRWKRTDIESFVANLSGDSLK